MGFFKGGSPIHTRTKISIISHTNNNITSNTNNSTISNNITNNIAIIKTRGGANSKGTIGGGCTDVIGKNNLYSKDKHSMFAMSLICTFTYLPVKALNLIVEGLFLLDMFKSSSTFTLYNLKT